jgi:2'-5' RNA ligase
MLNDGADSPTQTGIMIAFLPTSGEWCMQELPHMTLVYAGTTDKLSKADLNELAKDASTIAMMTAPFSLRVRGLEVFGEEPEQVKVLRFDMTPELFAVRRLVEHWNASQYKDFKPHATVGPVEAPMAFVPSYVRFDRILVSYGPEQIVFNLRGY